MSFKLGHVSIPKKPHGWRKWRTTALTSTIGLEKFQKSAVGPYTKNLAINFELHALCIISIYIGSYSKRAGVQFLNLQSCMPCVFYIGSTHAIWCWHKIVWILTQTSSTIGLEKFQKSALGPYTKNLAINVELHALCIISIYIGSTHAIWCWHSIVLSVFVLLSIFRYSD
jgi:uncharacterized membrane protein